MDETEVLITLRVKVKCTETHQSSPPPDALAIATAIAGVVWKTETFHQNGEHYIENWIVSEVTLTELHTP